MNELIGKLTNLTYEFFGVILPGFFAGLMLAVFWVALGPAVHRWSLGHLDLLGLNDIFSFFSTKLTVGLGIPILVASYFLGHLILWVARAGAANDAVAGSLLKRVGMSLVFRIPKPGSSYDASLKPLLDAVGAKLAQSPLQLEWRQFYPVTKSLIAQRLKYSLVATYQNKYTFHRSLVTAAAVIFWLSLAALVAGLLTKDQQVRPNIEGLGALVVISLVLISGFSGSYVYHWKMFGNTVITESYSLLYGPQREPTDDKKPASS